MSDSDTATVDAICAMALANGYTTLMVWRRAWERDGVLVSDTLMAHPGFRDEQGRPVAAGLSVRRVTHGASGGCELSPIGHPNDVCAWLGLVDEARNDPWQRDTAAEAALTGLGTSKFARVH